MPDATLQGQSPIHCDECGTHFLISPGDVTDGLACSECGGKRLFRDQPSTISPEMPGPDEGSLRDMIGDAASGQTSPTGGNPLQEGTIMGNEGEKPAFKRDNFMHSRVAANDPEGAYIPGVTHKEGWTPNEQAWFEYHCWRDHTSSDANLWYRSHQPVTVLKRQPHELDKQTLREGDGTPVPRPYTAEIRGEAGMPHFYQVQFPDGTPGHVAEDELYTHPSYWDPNGGPPPLNEIQQHEPTFQPYQHTAHSNTSQPVTEQVMYRETFRQDVYPALWHDEEFGKTADNTNMWAGGQTTEGPGGQYTQQNRQKMEQGMSPAQWGELGGATALGIGTLGIGDALGFGGAGVAEGVAGDAGAAATPAAETAAEGAAPAAETAVEQEAAKESPGLIQKGLAQGAKGMGIGTGEGLVKAIAPLMKGALGLGGGGAGAQGMSQAPGLVQTGSVSTADIPMLLTSGFVTADDGLTDLYQQVPSVDEQGAMDPHGFDQKEFSDGDRSPSNFNNPNLEDSGANGEDNARSDSAYQTGFAPNSPGIERVQAMLPTLMQYHLDPNHAGTDDPMVASLHDILNRENEGYLDNPHPESDMALQQLIDQHKHPSARGVHANTYGGTCPKCGGTVHQGSEGSKMCNNCMTQWDPAGNEVPPTPAPTTDPFARFDRGASTKEAIDMTPGGAPTTGTLPGQGPMNGIPAPQQANGQCPNCGGVMGPDGSCPQCGMGNTGQQNPMMGTAPPGAGASMALPPAMAGIVHHIATHQGPVTPEQIAAVQELLVTWDQSHPGEPNRAQEAPNVPLHPEQYATEMAEIQNNPNVAPQIDPNTQPQPTPAPAMQQAPGSMPVVDPSQPGGGGGQPMQPMAMVKEAPGKQHMKGVSDKRNRQYEHIKEQLIDSGDDEDDAKEEAARTVNKQRREKGETKKSDANTMTPRCPKCNSGSTTVDVGGSPQNLIGGSPMARCHSCGNVWDTGGHIGSLVFADEIALPNPHMMDHFKFADSTGNDLIEGQTYEVRSSSFSLPTEIRVLQVKPDGLEVQMVGGLGGRVGQPDFRISRQKAQQDKYTFVPLSLPAEHNTDPDTTPGVSPEQVPPIETTDGGSPEVNPHTVESSFDPRCGSCGSNMVDSSMLDPVTTEHDCVRCGNHWQTRDQDYSREAGLDLSWLDESPLEVSERYQSMEAAVGAQSRNLADVAARDPRLQAIRQALDSNIKEAGKMFSQSEKRALIDERGNARNLTDLDLDGTHYDTRADFTGKANDMNVEDDHFALGL